MFFQTSVLGDGKGGVSLVTSCRKFNMAASTSLVAYDSDSSNEEIDTKDSGDDGEKPRGVAVDISALKSKILLNSAPVVTAKVELKLQNIYSYVSMLVC